MTMHAVLRDLLEPVYRDSHALNQNLHAVQGGYHRLRTAAYEKFPQLIQPHPEYVYLTLTAHCNLRCEG